MVTIRISATHHVVAFFALFLANAGMAHAASKVVNCDGCTDLQKTAAATAETQNGRVYVTDRTNDAITAYDVVTYSELNPPVTVGIPTMTPSHIATYFDDLIGQYHTAQSSGVEVPSSIASSAHDLVGNGQLQAQVGEWLLGVFFESPTSGGQPDEELEEIRDRILSGEPVKAVFSDDSTGRFALVDFAVGDAELDLLDNSLSDAQLNPVPDSPSDVHPGFTGSFSSGGPGGLGIRDDFVNTLQLLGIGVSGSTSGGGTCSTFTCSSTPSGVECVFTVGSC